jgi:hypothetical protein
MPKLAAMVRQKYPGAYDDMDDATLERAVLAKYPEYRDLAADTGIGGTANLDGKGFGNSSARALEAMQGGSAGPVVGAVANAIPGVVALAKGVKDDPASLLEQAPGLITGRGATAPQRMAIGALAGIPAKVAADFARIAGNSNLEQVGTSWADETQKALMNGLVQSGAEGAGAAVGKALRGAGIGVVEATVRPPAAVKAQQMKPFEASRAIVENGLLSPRKANEFISSNSDKVSQAARASSATVNPRTLAQFPESMAKAGREAMPSEPLAALGDFAQQFLSEPENAGPMTMERLLDVKRSANRMSNAAMRASQREMPGGVSPIIGDASKELAQVASGELHTLVPETAPLDDLIRRGMLAKGALRAAEKRPHLISKLMATGMAGTGAAMGNPTVGLAGAAALMALDSPGLGSRLGSSLYNASAAEQVIPQIIRAAMLAKLKNEQPQ